MCYLRLPKINLSTILPILPSRPCLVVGMPVVRANFWRALVMPKARFHEKDKPGMGVERLLDMIIISLVLCAYNKI